MFATEDLTKVLRILVVKEKLLLLSAVAAALSGIGLGLLMSFRTSDPHWMNRAGAAIVALEAVVAAVEFKRKGRLELVRLAFENTMKESKQARLLVSEEIERSEWNVTRIALVLAVVGELLHGFGDLLVTGNH